MRLADDTVEESPGLPAGAGTNADAPDLLPAPGADGSGLELAGFGRRLAARVIDWFMIVYGIAVLAFVPLLVDRTCSVLTCATWLAAYVAVVVLWVAAYEVLPTSRSGRTLGKMALGIRVERADDDVPPSFGRAALRSVIVFVLLVVFWPVFLVSFLVARGSPRRQMWHDLAARTVVVRHVRERRGHRWARVAGVVAIVFAVLVSGGYVMHRALPNELIDVDFREGVAPFNVGESDGARFEHVGDTYVVTVKNLDYRLNTTLGDFVRTAYAVGIRAEVVEVTQAGTSVGVLCLGPAGASGDRLVGYGFLVEPGGAYSLERYGPNGSFAMLEHGTDPRIDSLERVSIICAPDLDHDVSLIGFANGVEVASAHDPDGYHVYTYAGLTVDVDRTGEAVRFTRVWAQVPDGEWIP